MEDKPPLYFTVDEWYRYNREQYRETHDSKIYTDKLIEQSDRTRDRAKELTIQQKKETEWRFKERIKDVDFVRVELESVRTLIQNEVEVLNILQERIQDGMKYVNANAGSIVEKCIQFRKGRMGIDLIHDEVETELEKEIKKIKEAESLLKKILEQTIEYKRDLRASLYLLNKDVEHKLNCLAIEAECLNLKETDMDLGVYQGYKPLNQSNTSIEEWSRYSNEIIKSSEKKIQAARLLQPHVNILLKEIIEDLRDQYFAVNDAFQRRITEVKEAKARLEVQHYEVARQINDMTRNIQELEKSVQEKEGFLVLAQTRLEKRSSRPGAEIVRDEVESSLIKEILQIKSSVLELQKIHSQAQASLRYLLKTQVQLEEDINIKTNSIKIDEVDCLTIRNITTGRQLYKHLLKECRRLPSGASEHYKHSIKQSFKQHTDETNPERIKEIITRALEDATWVVNKYTSQNKG